MTAIVPTRDEYADNVRSTFATARQAIDAAEQAAFSDDPLAAIPSINAAVAALRSSVMNVRGLASVQRSARTTIKV